MFVFQPAGSRHIVSGKFAHAVADVARDRLVGEPLASRRLGPQAFGFGHTGSRRPLWVISGASE